MKVVLIIKVLSIPTRLQREINLAINDPDNASEISHIHNHQEKFQNFEHVPDIKQQVDIVLVEVQILNQSWVIFNIFHHPLHVFFLKKVHHHLHVINFNSFYDSYHFY